MPRKYDYDAIIRDYEAGLGRRALHAKYGIVPSNLHYLLKRQGVLRSRSEALKLRWQQGQFAQVRKYPHASIVADYIAGLSMPQLVEKYRPIALATVRDIIHQAGVQRSPSAANRLAIATGRKQVYWRPLKGSREAR